MQTTAVSLCISQSLVLLLGLINLHFFISHKLPGTTESLRAVLGEKPSKGKPEFTVMYVIYNIWIESDVSETAQILTCLSSQKPKKQRWT